MESPKSKCKNDKGFDHLQKRSSDNLILNRHRKDLFIYCRKWVCEKRSHPGKYKYTGGCGSLFREAKFEELEDIIKGATKEIILLKEHMIVLYI